jgi:hypothetical protein
VAAAAATRSLLPERMSAVRLAARLGAIEGACDEAGVARPLSAQVKQRGLLSARVKQRGRLRAQSTTPPTHSMTVRKQYASRPLRA